MPSGTGTTQAGLVYGLKNVDVEVIGITVARTVKRCMEEIESLLDSLQESGGVTNCINIIDNMHTPYGVLSEKIVKISAAVSKTDGIFCIRFIMQRLLRVCVNI